MRSGLIAQKMGMTRVFSDSGDHVPVTVLRVDNCQVVAVRNEDANGYNALQLGVGTAKVKRVSKAMRGHFAKANVEPKRKLVEFRVSADAIVDVGKELVPSHFADGQFVDVTGTSIGKGFAGAMKRHNFSGMRASHGVSVSHRAHGSTGQCQDPGKVFKGKKMAGHLGDKRVTVQSQKIVSTDDERGLILVQGAVPGAKNGWVTIKDAVKRKMPDDLPFPAGLRAVAEEAIAVEEAPTEETAAHDAAAAEDVAPEAEAAGDAEKD